MWTQAQILAAFADEAGDSAPMATTADITRWFNEARATVDWHYQTTDDLTWSAEDPTVDLPSDLWQVGEIIAGDQVTLPGWRHYGAVLVVTDEGGAREDGTATILYEALVPAITSMQASLLPEQLDVACLSYAFHRFYRKVASSRTLYERYQTLAGSGTLEVSELRDSAREYLQRFNDERERVPLQQVSFFYPD